jgi:uncharacterized membrane protein YtjA (UPF0391 family)
MKKLIEKLIDSDYLIFVMMYGLLGLGVVCAAAIEIAKILSK